MANIVDQSACWNPLLTSAIFTWLGGHLFIKQVISFNISVTVVIIILMIFDLIYDNDNANTLCFSDDKTTTK